ncbi:TetR/AcrR family transcriptional regulator C-terminal domain-containing protein [Candidatus Berkiella aquae]|uniref:DNA-binding transcriptional repressor AcrR n=1 Tax=Candidatus Berkiella aquae TaxID=295108 RepID=A0A0Q9YL42_9GAMM|nr:TetR/AcrR family transcriptional regulator [Candidatus Berkiella aquae]MCS5712186.1 TetR/AcrR family transcriptional regulator [Candidatus Berkiella aquae]
MEKVTRRNNQRWVHKHHLIMEAATDLFLSEGYAATSMDAIASKAGISKITIYKHFENKLHLFNEMMIYHCQSLYKDAPIITFSLNVSSYDILLPFAKKIIELLSQPRSIALIRVIIAESEKYPEIVMAVWEAGRMPLQDIFCNYLAEEVAHARMQISNKLIASKVFFGMLKENFIWPALTGMPVPKAELAEEIIETIVAIFLKQYQI